MKNCAFTICSKNYLAQALTLKASFVKNNPSCDFFLFLADKVTEEVSDVELVSLDESWIPAWKTMAFKYEIIEFNTSIKPFCFNKLFNNGYDKVIYLDPDIYVTDSLQPIYAYLDKYDGVLTPHISYIQTDFKGAVPDTQLLHQGLYNLGFGAFKNSIIGHQIIDWWMKRLEENCYGETSTGLFVDQKWMNFIPLFFPDNILISKHGGINVAIWNLHERTLLIENSQYVIQDCKNEKYPLLFYHFSGFDPKIERIINRRHPNFNTDTYPSFKPLIEEYRELVINNGYEKYHPMSYGFGNFENGFPILAIQRRMLKRYIAEVTYTGNPFSTTDSFYDLLVKNGCLYKVLQNGNVSISNDLKAKRSRMENKILRPMLKTIKALVGIRKYQKLCVLSRMLGDFDYHSFLIKQDKV